MLVFFLNFNSTLDGRQKNVLEGSNVYKVKDRLQIV